jgi:hypothetical protein
MVIRAHLKLLPYLLLLTAAIVVGLKVTDTVQKSHPLLPGIRGCERLDGVTKQSECAASYYESRIHADTNAVDSETTRTQLVADVIAEVDKAAQTDAALAGICHPSMHIVGRDEGSRAAELGHTPVYPTFNTTSACTAGYVHGLSEGYLQNASTPDVAAVFPKLCHDPNSAAGCAHGIGHALLRAVGTSSSDVSASAARCGELPDGRINDCANGVFMELAMQGPNVSTSDYTSICSAMRGGSGTACWSYVPLNAQYDGVATAEIPALCENAGTIAAQGCIREFGRMNGPTEIRQCAGVAEPLRAACVEGAVVLPVHSGQLSEAKANAACATLTTDVAGCRRAVARAINPAA